MQLYLCHIRLKMPTECEETRDLTLWWQSIMLHRYLLTTLVNILTTACASPKLRCCEHQHLAGLLAAWLTELISKQQLQWAVSGYSGGMLLHILQCFEFELSPFTLVSGHELQPLGWKSCASLTQLSWSPPHTDCLWSHFLLFCHNNDYGHYYAHFSNKTCKYWS